MKTNKIKYKIVAEHKDKGKIEIPISRNLLHAMADLPFMMNDFPDLWETFKLNKIDKDIEKFNQILLFLAFDVDSDGYAYQLTNLDKKDSNFKWKKVKSDFIMVKKPRWKK